MQFRPVTTFVYDLYLVDEFSLNLVCALLLGMYGFIDIHNRDVAFLDVIKYIVVIKYIGADDLED